MIYLINTSPNKEGNSLQLGQKFLQNAEYQVLHLVDYQIEQYGQTSEKDQFFEVYEQISKADVIVFTSPIYWWSFSGLLKTFLDRIADVPYPPQAIKGTEVYFLLQGSKPSKEIEMLDYAMHRFCRNYGLRYKGLAVTDYALDDVQGWELAKLQEKLGQ